MRRPRYREFDRCGVTGRSVLCDTLRCAERALERRTSPPGSVFFVFDYQRDTLGRLWMVADSSAFLGIDGNMRPLRASSFFDSCPLVWRG